MELNSRIYIAGHRGLVGSALVRTLQSQGYTNLLLRTRSELDLMNPVAVEQFFANEKPEHVILAAAKVGGIKANDTYPVDFLFENLHIQANVIESSARHSVKKLCLLGSICIFPRLAPVPVKEEYLMSGPLEPTNECYALAKITGIKMCQAYRKQYGHNFISVMPVNLYGDGDNYDLQTSHVIPAMIRKFHEAKISNAPTVTCWGDGSARREFMCSDDCADAIVFAMNHYDGADIINIGYGKDYTIREIAEIIKGVVGYAGEIVWDTTKPNGTPKRLIDNSRMKALGWEAKIPLEVGLQEAYQWFLANKV
jgi:GDP-L-fucose synthase